jgi:hypothetical protein
MGRPYVCGGFDGLVRSTRALEKGDRLLSGITHVVARSREESQGSQILFDFCEANGGDSFALGLCEIGCLFRDLPRRHANFPDNPAATTKRERARPIVVVVGQIRNLLLAYSLVKVFPSKDEMRTKRAAGEHGQRVSIETLGAGIDVVVFV